MCVHDLEAEAKLGRTKRGIADLQEQQEEAWTRWTRIMLSPIGTCARMLSCDTVPSTRNAHDENS